MSETASSNVAESRVGHRSRHGFWFGVAVGAIAGALVWGAVRASSPLALAHGFRHHRGGGLAEADPEVLRERAAFASAFLIDRVEGTEAQKARAERILTDAIDALLPLAAEHRANRDALHTAFGQVAIDPGEIERIRQAEMRLADEASQELTRAFTELAGTLTVEQRSELMEMAHRFHR